MLRTPYICIGTYFTLLSVLATSYGSKSVVVVVVVVLAAILSLFSLLWLLLYLTYSSTHITL